MVREAEASKAKKSRQSLANEPEIRGDEMEPLKAVKTSRVGRRALVLIGIGVVSAGSVAGASFALTSSSAATAPTATASVAKSSTPAAKVRHRRVSILRSAISGDVELGTKNGFVTYDFDRGAVTSISISSITVLRPDSVSVTEALTAATHMPVKGVPTTGENVVVISTGGKATRIIDLEPYGTAKSGSTGGATSSSSASAGSTLS
jgi:hypothetical protein